jgi:hypothetical protein
MSSANPLSDEEKLVSKIGDLQDRVKAKHKKASHEATNLAKANRDSEEAVQATMVANNWQEIKGKVERLVDQPLALLKNATECAFCCVRRWPATWPKGLETIAKLTIRV